VAALVVAGCGSSQHSPASSAPTGTTPVTKAGFINQLSSLCTRANDAFSATHNLKGEVAVVSHYVALFGSLQPPAQFRSLYAKYVAVLQKELAALRQGNQNELFKLAHSQAKPLVKKIGATGCITSS
jgi:hypothetical protein